MSFKVKLLVFTFVITVLFVIWVSPLINRGVLPPMYSNTRRINRNVSENASHIYILLWRDSDVAPFYYLLADDVFNKNNCPFTNCIVTNNRKYFGRDMSKFHAIAFNGRLIHLVNIEHVPRSPHQKFIYYNTESPMYAEIASRRYNGFFNWTSTYRLDSDIPYPYIQIKDSSQQAVGPKLNMEWKEDMNEVVKDLAPLILSKSKAVMSFVSNCRSKSDREYIINQIAEQLNFQGYDLDIFGVCGDKVCRRTKDDICDLLIEDYYFYLAFENSLCEDYVTEKVMRALHHNTVPVVYGGANYSRFLPPGSYLNLRDYQIEELVTIMIDYIKHPDKYMKFFAWRGHYTFSSPMASDNVCALCTALNNKTKYEAPSVYSNIREWWHAACPHTLQTTHFED